MTCIVGLVDGGRVIIGADSAAVDNRYSVSSRLDRKVFRNGEFVIGFTSSFRMGQLLAHVFVPPPIDRDDLFAYMVVDFVKAARDCLKDGGFATRQNDQESGGVFLVGVRGRLFKIESDYQVAEADAGFDACGCGDLQALGSLYSTRGWNDAKDRVQEALFCAERLSAGVRSPFHIKSTGEKLQPSQMRRQHE